MAVSVLTRPGGYIISGYSNISVFDSDAIVGGANNRAIVQSIGHGFSNGAVVYLKTNIIDYNGFVKVDVYDSDYYYIQVNEAGSNYIQYIQNATGQGGTPLSFGFSHTWSCVHLPIVYKFSNTLWPSNQADTVRTISSVTNSNGYSALSLSGDIKTTGSAAVLEFVKITNSGGGGAFPSYDGVYQIISYTNDNTFSIDLSYDNAVDLSVTGASIQYYYNNYHLKVKINSGILSGHIFTSQKPYRTLATIDVIPDGDGVCAVSVNEIIKSLVYTKNNLLLGTLPNNLDFFTNFYIEVAEVYDTSDGTTLSVLTPTYQSDLLNFEGFAVNAKLPFKNIYSGSLSDYVGSDSNRKFLTLFDRPTIFSGKYFDISFLSTYYQNFAYPSLATFVNDVSGDIDWTLGSSPSVTVGGADVESARLNASLPRLKNGITYRISILLGSSISSNVELFAGFLNNAGAVVESDSSISGGTIFQFDFVGTSDSSKLFFKAVDLGGGGTVTISDYWIYPIDDTSVFDELIMKQGGISIPISNADEGVYRQQLTDPTCPSTETTITLYRKEILTLALPVNWSNFSAGTAFDTKGFSSFTESVTTVSVSPVIAYTTLTTATGEIVRITMPIVVSGGATFTSGIRVNTFLADGAGAATSNIESVTITADGTYSLAAVLTATGTGARIYVQCIRDGISAGTAVVVITIPETITNQKTAAISETKTIAIDCNCVKSKATGYYVSWINYLGGFDYWYFTGYADEIIEVGEASETEENILPEWPNSYGEFADTIRKQTFRESRQQVLVRSQHVTREQLEVLKTIKTSPLVQIVNSIYDRRTVTVDDDSFTYLKEENNLHEISFTITYTDDVPSQKV